MRMYFFSNTRSEVAQNLERDSYGLIFGFNNFIALILGSLCTYFVIQGHLITLTAREQVWIWVGRIKLKIQCAHLKLKWAHVLHFSVPVLQYLLRSCSNHCLGQGNRGPLLLASGRLLTVGWNHVICMKDTPYSVLICKNDGICDACSRIYSCLEN